MKIVLVLCVLAFMIYEKDIIDIDKSIYIASFLKELIWYILGRITDIKAIEDETKVERPFCTKNCGHNKYYEYATTKCDNDFLITWAIMRQIVLWGCWVEVICRDKIYYR